VTGVGGVTVGRETRSPETIRWSPESQSVVDPVKLIGYLISLLTFLAVVGVILRFVCGRVIDLDYYGLL
jgi:hypothetical protein